VVPAEAVQTGQNGDFVFVVKPDLTVDLRPVTTSISYEGLTVITSGVRPRETVVTDGQLRLTPGARISAKSPPTPGSAAKAAPTPEQN
jgi:multidrug efflux system membrane fusion protein